MADFVDLFAGTGSLDLHTSDSGNPWGRFNSGQGPNAIQLSSGYIYDNIAVAGGKEYISGYLNASADCLIRALVRVGTISGAAEIGLWGRMVGGNSTANKGYMGRYAVGFGWQIFTLNNAAYNQIGTTVAGTAPADGDTIQLSIVGSSPVVITVKLNGVTQITQNDSGNFLTALGSPGFHMYNPGGLTTTNYKFRAMWSGAPSGPTLALALGSTALTVGGATTTATPSGFTGQSTSPPTYTSSNTAVATINSTTGVITPVGPGTCTFTAVGSIFSLETFTSVTLTVSAASVATATIVSLGATSGYAGDPVTVTVGSNGTFSGTKACTFSDGGAGGSFTSFTPIAQTPATGTVQYTPAPGTTSYGVTITATLAGLSAASVGYNVTADTLVVSPTVLPINTTTTVTFTNAAGLYTSAPTFTTALSGVTIGASTRIDNFTATAPVTVGSTAGSGNFFDSTDGAAAPYTTAAVAPYLSQISGAGFTPGLTTVGYTIYYGNSSSVYQTRSQSGVIERPGAIYTVLLSLPYGQSYLVDWDNGTGSYGGDGVTIPAVAAGSVTVAGYSTGQDPASLLLLSPANKLATDNTGAVPVQMGQALPATPTAGTHGYSLAYGANKVGRFGIAQGGSTNTITLDSGASSVNDAYKDHLIKLTTNTGAGQFATILAYNGTTKVATIWRPASGNGWSTSPDATTGFVILPEAAVNLEPTQAFNNTGQTTAFVDTAGVSTLLTRITGIVALASQIVTPDNADIVTALADIVAVQTSVGTGLGSLVTGIKSVTDKLNTALQSDGAGGYQLTTLALAHAPAGGGGGTSASAITTAIFQNPLSSTDFQTANSFGIAMAQMLGALGADHKPLLSAATHTGAIIPRVTLTDTTTNLTNGGGGGGASASAIATAIWEDLLAGGDFGTAGSIGLAIAQFLGALATDHRPILNAAGLDQVQVESGINARQALSPILAAAAGKVSGAGTGAITITGGNNSTPRIAAVTDTSGNRTAVTLSLPN